MKKFIVVLLCLLNLSQAQNTSRVQISLITCSPGQDLYSIFGHTAIRVIDSTNGTDLFYNYGTFDFDDGFVFYLNFTRGKLNYYLNTDQANDFFSSYVHEGRTITEQVLNLSNEQKQNIQQFLKHNISGSNKYYKYDFLFDNCTTRARDLLDSNANLKANYQLVGKGTTFRNMLHCYLDSGGMCWSKFGIDILLGSLIDKPVTKKQSSFLPDYLMYAVDSANLQNSFILKTNVYNKLEKPAVGKFDNYLPLIIFTLIASVIVGLFFYKTPKTKAFLLFYSKFTLFVTGIIGLLLLFMWFATDHKSCAYNYNLLWALPTNLIALFLVNKKNNIAENYFLVATLFSFFLAIFFMKLPQQFNIALLPYVLSNMLCYKFLWDRNKSEIKLAED